MVASAHPEKRAAVDARRSVDDQALRWAATFFAAAVILHNGDHLRRGVETSPHDVLGAGILSIVLEVGLVVLVFQRHRLAPVAAAVGGLALAGGYVEVHFLPAHALLSDSFTTGGHTSPLSWAAASLEVVAALVLGASGLAVLSRRRDHGSVSGAVGAQRRLAEAATRPVPLVLITTQTLGLAVGLVQLVRA